MKDVIGYEGLYAVTSCGKVWSYKSKKFLSPGKDKVGYLRVGLYKDGKRKDFLVHRLVAEAYIDNPDNLEEVDHLDEDKSHNYINNLQWVTRAENTCRAHNKKVKCLETDEVFESVKIAAKEMNLCRQHISAVCLGKQKTTGGYHFEYV